MMMNEQLPADFYRYFLTEELFSIPEDQKMASAGSAVPSQPTAVAHPEPATPENSATTAEPEPQKVLPFVFKGGNKKNVAVLVNMFEGDFANITQHQMLMRLLAAIKLGADDVAFVNLSGQINDMKEIAEQVIYDNAILFLNPKHPLIAHHKLKQFQPMSVNGKYTIAAAELSALQSNEQQKRQLWTGLQAMFL